MATFNAKIGFDMINQIIWHGSYLDGVNNTAEVFVLGDVTRGISKLDIYDGSFKYSNGHIKSGTVTSYSEYQLDQVTFDLVEQFNITGLKLDAKTIESIVISDGSQLLALALKGNDTINGSAFDDGLIGYTGNDTINGKEGNDKIVGGKGKDIIYGDNGDDILLGDFTGGNDSSIDVINGGNGDDFLNGMLGKDILTGGSGDDGFIFNTKLGSSNVDTITDFLVSKAGEPGDTLYLDIDIFTNLTKSVNMGDLANNFVIGTKALDSDDYLIFNPTTHTLSYDADGSGSGKAVAFVILTGVTTLLVEDIWVW